MKVLVTGAKGLLGKDIVKRLNELGIENKGVDIEDFDIVSQEDTLKAVKEYLPDVIVNCAAYTAVDRAEEQRELCYAVNVIGAQNIARACAKVNAKLIHFSTDYVFDGKGQAPFEVDSPINPINYYGYTKAESEKRVKELTPNHFIVRISWVFGINKGNFVTTMLKLAKSGKEINVVNDQIGSPTFTWDLACLVCKMAATEKYGTYHATNEGFCSWYDFAREIFLQSGIGAVVNPVSSESYKAKAARPKNSRLSKDSLERAGFERLPHWKDALSRYLSQLK